MTTIAVTGATGQLGRLVVAALLDRGAPAPNSDRPEGVDGGKQKRYHRWYPPSSGRRDGASGI